MAIRWWLAIVSGCLVLGLTAPACGGPQATPTGAKPSVTPAASGTTAAAQPSPAATGRPEYSAHVLLWGNPQAERDLKLAKDAGFESVKQMFQWNYIEPDSKGKFEWNEPDRLAKLAEKLALKIVARVDIAPLWSRDPASDLKVSGPPRNLKDFSEFMYALASRYKKGSPQGRIHAYEIWNEPNLAREWGGKPPSPKEYLDLLKTGYEAVKRADPDAIVISAGLSPTTASGNIAMPDEQFLKAIYDAGASAYFDVLGVHGAGYKAPPEKSPDEVAADPSLNHGEGVAGRIYCFRHVEDLRKIMIQYGDEKKKVAVMEFGWTSDNRPGSPYLWHSVTEEQKADYIVRAFQFAAKNWSPWIGPMTVIYVCSPLWTPKDEQYYWCISNPDGTLRPAYEAVQRMPK